MADTHQLSMFIVVIATEQYTVAVIQYLPDGGQAGEERCAQCYLIKPENHRDLPAFIYYLFIVAVPVNDWSRALIALCHPTVPETPRISGHHG